MTMTKSIARSFYLTQRFNAPYGGVEKSDPADSQAGYVGDYMGSTEFECGGLNKAFKAMRDAKELAITVCDVDGVSVSMLYVAADGDPSADLLKWYAGGERGLKGEGASKCPGKERSRFEAAVAAHKAGEPRDDYDGTAMWWSHGMYEAEDNVIFGLSDEPHFANFVGWINNRREAADNKAVQL